LGVITYIGNHGDRGEYGSEKQFNNSSMLPLGHTVPSFMFHFLRSSGDHYDVILSVQ